MPRVSSGARRAALLSLFMPVQRSGLGGLNVWGRGVFLAWFVACARDKEREREVAK